jgi:hypothetical protein
VIPDVLGRRTTHGPHFHHVLRPQEIQTVIAALASHASNSSRSAAVSNEPRPARCTASTNSWAVRRALTERRGITRPARSPGHRANACMATAAARARTARPGSHDRSLGRAAATTSRRRCSATPCARWPTRSGLSEDDNHSLTSPGSTRVPGPARRSHTNTAHGLTGGGACSRPHTAHSAANAGDTSTTAPRRCHADAPPSVRWVPCRTAASRIG